jgi:CHAT domain-containing protein
MADLPDASEESVALQMPSFEELKDRVAALPEGAVVGEYFVAGPLVYVFTLAKGREPRVTTVPRSQLNPPAALAASVRGSRGLGQYPPTDPRPGAALVEPLLAEEGPVSAFYLIPHGELTHAPLHAASCRGGVLLDHAPVIYLPSLMLARPTSATPDRPALVLGNMTGDLPGAQEEAVAVARLLGTEPLLGREATLKTFVERARGPALIHLAGHGYFDPDQPLTSGLPFPDGILTMSRIHKVRLAGAVVVLSGCVTGVGVNRPGEGFASLMAAFFAAGARAVLVSLWPVDDQATAQLMREVYTARFEEGLTWPAAIRRGMMAVRRTAESRCPAQAPYFWAPFKAVGNW